MTWAAAVAGALAWSAPALAKGDETTEGGPGKLGSDIQESLQKLHATNQAEIQLARTAESRAQSAEVKQFAQKMVQDHQRGDQKLQQTAQRLGVALEGEKYQDALQEMRDGAKDLQQMRGAEFDRAFMAEMVRAHTDALKEVHDTATKAGEQGSTQLAEMLGQTEAALHGHHAQAERIQQQLQQHARAQPGGTGAGDQPADRAGAGQPQSGQDGAMQPGKEQQKEQKYE